MVDREKKCKLVLHADGESRDDEKPETVRLGSIKCIESEQILRLIYERWVDTVDNSKKYRRKCRVLWITVVGIILLWRLDNKKGLKVVKNTELDDDIDGITK